MAKFCIEIAGPQNESAKFSPTKDRVRGRWTAAFVAHRNKGETPAGEAMKALSRIDIIPGQYIELDASAGRGRIFDPLEKTPEGKRIWAEIKEVFRRHPGSFDTLNKLQPEKTYEELGADGVKTWAFHMRTLIDIGMAQYVNGSEKLPSITDIRHKMPGRRAADPLNSSHIDGGRWVDAVPSGKELAGAGAGADGGNGKKQSG